MSGTQFAEFRARFRRRNEALTQPTKMEGITLRFVNGGRFTVAVNVDKLKEMRLPVVLYRRTR
jgi:hypothetical protein